MKPPGIGIDILPIDHSADGGSRVVQEIEVSGNRSGLLQLAELIRVVAESDQPGYHTHLFPDDPTPLLRTPSYSLTITKNSDK